MRCHHLMAFYGWEDMYDLSIQLMFISETLKSCTQKLIEKFKKEKSPNGY